MSKNTTDTNQASEDELGNILRSLAYDAMESGVDNSKHGYIYSDIDELLPTAKAAIQSLIRTEKLKLLAEVRERVVGENDYQPGNPAPDLVEHNRLVRDGLRHEQRVALAKLEAEL